MEMEMWRPDYGLSSLQTNAAGSNIEIDGFGQGSIRPNCAVDVPRTATMNHTTTPQVARVSQIPFQAKERAKVHSTASYNGSLEWTDLTRVPLELDRGPSGHFVDDDHVQNDNPSKAARLPEDDLEDLLTYVTITSLQLLD